MRRLFWLRSRNAVTLGRNLAYDVRASGGDNSKLPEVLEDFKASSVDVIVTIGYPATLAAKTAGIAPSPPPVWVTQLRLAW